MCNSKQKSTVTQTGFIEPLKTTQISSKFLFPVFTSNNTARITIYLLKIQEINISYDSSGPIYTPLDSTKIILLQQSVEKLKCVD